MFAYNRSATNFILRSLTKKGAYKISVPVHVTSLYISTDGYNAVQVGLRTGVSADAYLYDSKFASLYHDGTTILNKAKFTPNESSSISPETDIENNLNAAVRTISRGGLPAQGAAMFVNGINSLNANAQPLVVVDGGDLGYAVRTYHFAKDFKDREYDKLADVLRQSLDMEQIYQIINREEK